MKCRNPGNPIRAFGRALAGGVLLFLLCCGLTGCALTDQQRAGWAAGLQGASQSPNQFQFLAPQPQPYQAPVTKQCYSQPTGGGYSYVTCN